MRGSRYVPSIALAAAAMLLGSGVALAQAEGPASTPPPPEVPGVTTVLLRSELTDPAVDRAIEEAARFAHSKIGGRRGGRGEPFRTELLADTADILLRARQLADESHETDDPISVMVLSGGDSAGSAAFVAAYPGTIFVDVDQAPVCLTAEGTIDTSGTCAGDLAPALPNHATVTFESDQAAYLAGVLAASASRNDRLGIIGGARACGECNRTIHGFARGARSIKPGIDIEVAYLTSDAAYDTKGGEQAAFGDEAAAKTFARAFIDVYEPDVVLPLAGAASRGIIEAVCESEGVLAVGGDFDVSAAYPELASCVLASITKDQAYAVREAIFSYARQTITPQTRLGLDDGRVGVTGEWLRRPGIPSGLKADYDDAQQRILTGQVRTCPRACTQPFDPTAPVEDEPLVPEASPGDFGEEAPSPTPALPEASPLPELTGDDVSG